MIDSRVAPFAGAWIEIKAVLLIQKSPTVAPFAGAWIEIVRGMLNPLDFTLSHPSRVRGLKSNATATGIAGISRTLRGCVD